MADLKTKKNRASVQQFLASVDDEKRRKDARVVLKLMREITGEKPAMWGASIVGFGSYHYRYESGREGDWMLTGFSPRKQALTLYIMGGFDRHDGLMSKLGRYKTGKSCLYVKNLEDIDLEVLRELVAESVAYMRRTYG
jgi:hypothetical protein